MTFATETGTLIHFNPRRASLRGPDFFSELRAAPLFRGPRVASLPLRFVPRLDAVETDDAYRITAELPGLEEADFELLFEDGVMTLKGEKQRPAASPASSADSDGDEDAVDYRRVEIRVGRFERRLRFDVPIQEQAVSASYKNGVLTVVVPKVAEARPQVHTIPVQTN